MYRSLTEGAKMVESELRGGTISALVTHRIICIYVGNEKNNNWQFLVIALLRKYYQNLYRSPYKINEPIAFWNFLFYIGKIINRTLIGWKQMSSKTTASKHLANFWDYFK